MSAIRSKYHQRTYYPENALQNQGIVMCEFNVILNGKSVFKDAVYAKNDGDKVIVKSILGETKEFKGCKISEVDVNSEKLILAKF